MNITKKIKTNLTKLGLTLQEKAVWLEIATEELEHDGYFHLDEKEYAEKLNISDRYLRTHLNKLEQLDLIIKDIRPSDTTKRLFVCPLQPETNDCMTFYATFAKGELLNTADNDEPSMWLLFKDIYNRSGTIRFSQCSALLKGNEMKRCQNLIPGKTVCFSASLKVTQSDKEILAVTNIQPTQRYYYA